MDDSDKKFFDISKPKRMGPHPAGRPVIVGHHPTMPDPMIREQAPGVPAAQPMPAPAPQPAPQTAPQPMPQPEYMPQPSNNMPGVADMSAPQETAPALAPSAPMPGPAAGMGMDTAPPAPSQEMPMTYEPAPTPSEPHPLPASVPPPQAYSPPQAQPTAYPQPPQMPAPPEPLRQEELHVPAGNATYHHKPRIWAWLLALLIIIAGAYAAVDAKTDVKLPYEVFKQTDGSPNDDDSNTPGGNNSQQPNNPPPQASGIERYQPTGAPITFAYPTEWGEPKTTNDPGFSERGEGKKSDGVHAYLVTFSKNKDIEIAITSAKFLPAKRTPLYYDFLHWCEGSNDQKIYKETIRFNTDKGIDKPSTRVCDQGPLNDAEKINTAVIVQKRTKDAEDKVLGDVYTANLSDATLAVFRVKDAKMTNGDAVKTLLGSIAGAANNN